MVSLPENIEVADAFWAWRNPDNRESGFKQVDIISHSNKNLPPQPYYSKNDKIRAPMLIRSGIFFGLGLVLFVVTFILNSRLNSWLDLAWLLVVAAAYAHPRELSPILALIPNALLDSTSWIPYWMRFKTTQSWQCRSRYTFRCPSWWVNSVEGTVSFSILRAIWRRGWLNKLAWADFLVCTTRYHIPGLGMHFPGPSVNLLPGNAFPGLHSLPTFTMPAVVIL